MFIFLVLLFNILEASISSSVKILDISSDLKLLSQDISKNYAYNYYRGSGNNAEIKPKIIRLSDKLRDMSVITKDVKIKQILNFFDYEKMGINRIVDKEITEDNVIRLLSFSELVEEGTNYLDTYIKYEYNNEEKMLNICKNIEYESEKFLNYYILLSGDIDQVDLMNKILISKNNIEEHLVHIEEYIYPGHLEKLKNDLNEYLTLYNTLYSNINQLKTPSLVLMIGENFHAKIDQFINFHAKHQ